MASEETRPASGFEVVDYDSCLTPDCYSRPGMSRAGWNDRKGPPFSLRRSVEVALPPAAVLVHRLQPDIKGVAAHCPTVERI